MYLLLGEDGAFEFDQKEKDVLYDGSFFAPLNSFFFC